MLGVHIRWMIRRDMYEILEIEKRCFGKHAWNEEVFIQHLRTRNMIGMVAEWDEDIIGYMVYALHKSSLELLNLAVEPKYQRSGIGSAMIDKLKGKLNPDRRSQIMAMVSEFNLTGQLFFRSQGFLCTCIEKNYYDDTDFDAYRMEFNKTAAMLEEAQQAEWRMRG